MEVSHGKSSGDRARSRSWLGQLAQNIRRYGLALGIAGAALAPTVGVVWQAAARGEDEPAPRGGRRVLAAIPKNPSILINVTWRDMPSSADILHLGKRSTQALERCLSDNADATIRRHCAMLLGELGDRRALPGLRAALDDWDAEVRRLAIWALAGMPDRDSFEPLMKLYRREDEEHQNRVAVVHALGTLSERRAVQVLRKVMRDELTDVDLPGEAFSALWMSRHLMARPTLTRDVIYALRSDDYEMKLAAVEAAAELRSPRLVTPLVPLLQHRVADVRNKAAYALGRIGDRKATRALLAALPKVREARMLNNIAFALERLDRKAFYPAIQQLIQHKQAVIRLNAAFVIGDVKQPEGLPLLVKALDDPSDYVKASTIVAIGKLGVAEGGKSLERFVGDANPSLRQESIYAINQISKGQRADLIHERLFASQYAKSPRRRVLRQRAALTLGRAGDQRVREYLLACYEQGRCSYRDVRPYLEQDQSARVAGRLLLQWANGRRELTSLVGQRRLPGTLTLALSEVDSSLAARRLPDAMAATDLVGAVGNRDAHGRLRPQLAEVDTWLRLHTAVALLRLGDAAAARTLLRDLDNLPASWLPAFARVTARITEQSAIALLRPELEQRSRSQDTNLALASAAVLLAWNPEQGFFRFLDALAADSAQERDLAEAYLSRNHDRTLTFVMRRALARENRASTRDRLRQLVEARD